MRSEMESGSIRVYCCSNAEFAGELRDRIARLELGHDVIIEAVPCSGKVDPRYIMKAFEGGAHGICVLGCQKDACMMIEGNLRATRRVQTARNLLAEAGLNPDSVNILLQSTSGSMVDEAANAVAAIDRIRHRTAHEVVA